MILFSEDWVIIGYTIIVVAWAAVMMEYWKQEQSKWVFRWGMMGVEQKAPRIMHSFQGVWDPKLETWVTDTKESRLKRYLRTRLLTR